MNIADNEKYFAEILKNDITELLPDKSVERRLDYIWQLKSKKNKLRENSVFSVLTGLFSLHHFGLKAGVIAALFLITMLFSRFPGGGNIYTGNEHLLADSSYCDTLARTLPELINNPK